jgi:four helix bundle protein
MNYEWKPSPSSDLRQRTKEFALRIIHLCSELPDQRAANKIGDQLLRSGTSVGANYREACRGRSKADFISKMCIAIQELDETLYWLELLCESGIVAPRRLEKLMNETDELLAIFTACVKKTKENNNSTR